MKKCFFLFLALIMLLSSCRANNANIFIGNSEIKKYGEVKIEGFRKGEHASMLLVDEKIVLPEITDGKYILYVYDIKNESLVKAGEVKDFAIGSNKKAYLNGSLYFNVGVGELSDIKNEFYSIDLKTAKLNKIKRESIYQTLVPTFVFGDRIVSVKGDLINGDEQKGISYLESYSPKTNRQTRLLQRNCERDSGNGEIIENACAYNDYMYVLNVKDKEYFIEKYNSKVKLTESYAANEIIKLLQYQIIQQFEMLDQNTFFISNLSGDFVICSLKNGKLEILSNGSYDEPWVVATSSENFSNKNILYQLLGNEMVLYNNGEVEKIELDESYKLRIVCIDGNDIIYEYSDENDVDHTYFESIDELFKESQKINDLKL